MKTCTLPFHLKTICFLLIKLYVFVVVVFALFFKKVQSYFLVLATHWENCLKWAKIMQTSARVGCSEPLQMPQFLLHLTVPKYCGTQVPQESLEGNLSRNPRPSLFTSLENQLGEHILAANDWGTATATAKLLFRKCDAAAKDATAGNMDRSWIV